MSWRRLRSLMAPLLAMILVLSSVVSASAAAPLAPSDADLIPLLQSYGLVKGDQFGNLNLLSPITRAEAATVFVRAVGQEQTAKLVANVSSFPDTNGHWAAGYITTAYRLGQMKGRDTGMFDPDARITNAEVLTVLLRIVEKEPSGIWTPNRAVQAAIDLGIYSGGSPEVVANLEAVRGVIFRSLAKAMTTVPLSTGKTALATYIDQTPPTLTVNAVPSTTANASLTVSGTASDAAYVLVNGQKATLTGINFQAEVALAGGQNTIKVEAFDWAGNRTLEERTVARGGDATRIELAGNITVDAGQSTVLAVKVYDANGIQLSNSLLSGTVSNNLGSFDAATGTFRAGNTAGQGKLTLKAGKATLEVPVTVQGVATQAYALRIVEANLVSTQGRPATVTVAIMDRNGQPVTWDAGRPVTLTASGLTDLRVTSASTQRTNQGMVTFTVAGLQEGTGTLTATASGLASASTLIQIASTTRVVLVPSTTSATADGTTPVTVRAKLQDENGATVVNNSGRDIAINLALAGSPRAYLSNRVVVIRSGQSESIGFDGALTPSLESEVVSITGTIQSTHTYTVLGASVTFNKATSGVATRLELAGGGTFTPGSETQLSVTVRDAAGNLMSTGSYAFQVQVTTSYGDPGPIPEGVTLTLGNSSASPYVPVAGAPGAIIARTVNGFATLTLKYTKSGTVTVRLLPANPASGAVDAGGTVTTALPTLGWTMGERTVTFAGAAVKVGAVADLPHLGLNNQSTALLPANGATQARLKLQVLDVGDGVVTMAGGTASLLKISGSSTVPVNLTSTVVNGVAEFLVTASTTPGTDVYELSWSGISTAAGKKQISVTVSSAALAPAPNIVSINGYGGPGVALNRVRTTDTHMEIQLSNYPVGTYGFVKVYRGSNNGLVYTSQVMSLSGGPYIRVPRANLVQGADWYWISINNGAGEAVSGRYPVAPDVVSVEVPVTLNIQQVRYNATNSTLTATVPGMTAGGIVDITKLSFTNSGGAAASFDPAATCVANSGYFTCSPVTVTPGAGTIYLNTATAWYRYDAAGQVAVADTNLTDNLLTPLAYISQATVRFLPDNSAQITLTGVNLNQGVIHTDLLLTTPGSVALGQPGQTIAATSPNGVTFTVNSTIGAALKALTGPGIRLSAGPGWFVSGSDTNPTIAATIPLFKEFSITGASYSTTTKKITLTGTGFLSGTVDTSKLKLVKRDGTLAGITFDPNSVANPSDTSIELILASGGDATLELAANSLNGNVFLVSETTSLGSDLANPADDVYWFKSADNWYATGLQERTYLLAW